jgi:hypothetical protein
MAATIQINGVAASDDDLPINVLVQLNDSGGGAVWLWELLDIPLGSTAALSNPALQNPTFTPDVEGTYLIKLTEDATTTDQKIAAVRQLKTRERIPAAGETTENNAADGWSKTQGANDWLRLVDNLRADPGVYVAETAVGGLAAGDVLKVTGIATIKSGLPGVEIVPSVNQALATLAVNVDGALGILVAGVDGSPTPGANELVYVRYLGRYAGLVGVPTVGDPVYVDDAGVPSLTAGTVLRQIGQVMDVAATYTMFINGSANASSGGSLAGAPVLMNGAFAAFPSGVNVQALAATLNYIWAGAVGTVPFQIRGVAGQTADLQRWVNSALAVLAGVQADGVIYTNGLEVRLNEDAVGGTAEDAELVLLGGDGAATVYEARLIMRGTNFGVVDLVLGGGLDTVFHIGEYDSVAALDNVFAMGSGDAANETRAQFRFSDQDLYLEDGGGARAFTLFNVAVVMDMGTNKITGLGDPTLVQDATTKIYVDPQVVLKDVDDTPYTAANREYVQVDCNSGAGSPAGVTVLLPAPVTGMRINVMKIDATAQVVTVDGNAGPLINGAATRPLGTQWQSETYYSNGTDWFVE